MVDSTARQPLLGSTPGDLALRIRGTSRNGQVVRLSSNKCTVGSDRRCTLRLQAPGVGPLHCLILRGEKQTIVRRWSNDTRLNGRAFTDSPLFPGDRLGIGSIEFEILDPSSVKTVGHDMPEVGESDDTWTIGRLTRKNEELKAANRQARRRARRLIKQLREMKQRLAQPEVAGLSTAQAETLREKIIKLESDARLAEQQRRQWAAEKQDLEKVLADNKADHKRQLDELSAERRVLLADQQRHVAEQQKAEQSLAQAEAQLLKAQAELEDQQRRLEALQQEPAQKSEDVEALLAKLQWSRDELESRRQAWLNEQEHAQLEFQREQSRIDQETTRLAAERKALDQARRAWEAERKAGESAAQSAAAATQLAELQAKQQQLDQERTSWENERLAAEHRLGQKLAEVEHQLAAFEQQRTDLVEQKAAWEDQLQKANSSQSEQRRVLDEQLATLEAQRKALEQEKQSWQEELAANRAELEQTELELAERNGRLNELAEQINADRAMWEDEQRRREDELARRADELSEQTAELERRRDQLDRKAQEIGSQPSEVFRTQGGDDSHCSEDRLTEDDAFARLRTLSLLKSDDSSIDGKEELPNQETDNETAARTQSSSLLDDEQAAPEPGHSRGRRDAQPKADASPADDESIDDYMAKLLSRVRGHSSEGSQWKAASSAQPVRNNNSALQAVETGPPPKVTPPAAAKPELVERVRRELPPELTSNLAAMRELANSQARGAIGKHVHQRWIKAAIGKASVALVGLIAGILLILWSESNNSASFFGGIAGLLISVFWGLQSAILTKHVWTVTQRDRIAAARLEAVAKVEESSSDG